MTKQESPVILKVRVTPRMARSEISGILEDGTVKVKITAPPVEGKANECLTRFFADLLGVKTSSITVLSGKTGRTKLISITGLGEEQVHGVIKNAMDKDEEKA